MTIRIEEATREQLKLRMGLCAPAKAGKTYDALTFAFALASQPFPHGVCVIETEHRSAAKYAGYVVDGVKWKFNQILLTDFSPSSYVEALNQCAQHGFDVVIIDSLSHAWAGEGGALDIKDKYSDNKGENSFTAWRHVTPMHNRMIETILRAPFHIIATMRTHMEYVMEANEKGKMIPRKVGMKPIQRAGMEYEFDIIADIDNAHVLTVSGSRCQAVDNQVVSKPSGAFMRPIIDWLSEGHAPEPRIASPQREKILELCALLAISSDGLSKGLRSNYGKEQLDQLTEVEAAALISKLDAKVSAKVDEVLAQQNAPQNGQEAASVSVTS